MPTRAGWLVALGAVASIIAGRTFGTVELYVLGAVAGAVLVLALAWVRRPLPQLVVDRQVSPDRVTVGGLGRVEIVVSNRGGRTPVVTLVDPVEGTVGAQLTIGPLAAGGASTVGYRLPTRRRGLLAVGPLTAELADPFGLAARRVEVAGERTITILPAIDVIGAGPMGAGRHQPLAGRNHRAMATAGHEDLATLRPYVVGDDLRRVHWPSSARTDGLLVRRDEEQWQGHLTVVVDTRHGALAPVELERAISAAAGLIQAAGESGDQVRLVTSDGVDSGMVDAHRAASTLLERLALVAPLAADASGDGFAEVQGDPRQRSALVVLTGAGDPPAAGPPGAFGPVVVVRFADPAAIAAGPAGQAGQAGRTAEQIVVGPGTRFADAWDQHRRSRLAAVSARRPQPGTEPTAVPATAAGAGPSGAST